MHIDFIKFSRWHRVTDPDVRSCKKCQMVLGVIRNRPHITPKTIWQIWHDPRTGSVLGSVKQGHRENWVKSICTTFGEECTGKILAHLMSMNVVCSEYSSYKLVFSYTHCSVAKYLRLLGWQRCHRNIQQAFTVIISENMTNWTHIWKCMNTLHDRKKYVFGSKDLGFFPC